MTDYTWTDNSSGNTNWNDQSNWNDGASGYPDGNDDTATFDATWTSNCTVNAAITVGAITTTSGYTGTITQTASMTIDDAGGESGQLTLATNGTWDCNGQDYTSDDSTIIDGGTFYGGEGTLSCGSGITANYGFRINSGTVDFESATCLFGSLRCAGTVTLSSGVTTLDSALAANDSALVWISNPTFDDGDGTVTFTGTADPQQLLEDDNTARTLYNVIINKASGTVNWRNGAQCTLTIANDLTITSGTYESAEQDGTPANLNVGNDLTGAGTFHCKTATIDVTGDFMVNTINMDAATVTVDQWFGDASTTCTVSGTSAATINCGRHGQTAFTPGNSTVNMIGGASTDVIRLGSGSFYNLVVNGAGSETYNLKTAITVDNDLTITVGELNTDVGNYALTVTGACSITGTLTGNASAISFGSLTIQNGGTYGATTGITTITTTAELVSGGTFTHNGGTMFFNLSGAQNLVGTGWVFENLDIDGARLSYSNGTALTIEGDLTGTGQIRLVANGCAVTYGTTAASCTASIASVQGANVAAQTHQAASESYPVLFTTVGPLFLTNDTTLAATNTNLKWIDVQRDIVTGGGTKSITLTGNCEFDSFTVTAGDTLDFNGYIGTFSGTLDCDGVLDTSGGSTCIANVFDYNGTSWTSDSNFVLQLTGTGTAGINSSKVGTYFINAGSGTVTQETTHGSIASNKFIVGSGTYDSNTSNATVANEIIANGGTHDAGTGTLTVTGDWYSCGGLIGKSAFQGDNSTEFGRLGAPFSETTGTVEAWFKTSVTGETQRIFDAADASDDGIRLNIAISNTLKLTINGDDTEDTTNVCDGKWHHVAATFDGSDTQLFLDGKLVATGTASAVSTTTNASISTRSFSTSQNYFGGEIAMIRCFTDVRTASELRADMFNAYADMADTGALWGMWQFDEATGTAVDNKEGTAARDITLDSAAWVSGGTFTYGTSTVDFTGTGTICCPATIDWYNINIAAATKTTTWDTTQFDILGSLTQGTGTVAGTVSGLCQFKGDFTHTISGGDLTWMTGTVRFENGTPPGTTYETLQYRKNSGTITQGGNIICNTLFQITNTTIGNSGGFDITAKEIDIDSNDELVLEDGSTLTFTNVLGFGASDGTLTCNGSSGTGVTITHSGASGWDFTTSLSVTADYTTVNGNGQCSLGGTIDIDNCTFTNVDSATGIAFRIPAGATITSFTNNSIDGGTETDALRVDQTHTAFDNIVITGTATNEIHAADVLLEFANSNFDETKVDLDTSGNVISKTHDDVANQYYVIATDLNYTSVTNNHLITDNVTIIAGIYNIDLAGIAYSDDFTVNSGTTLVVDVGATLSVDLLYNNGTVTNNGTIIQRGAPTVPGLDVSNMIDIAIMLDLDNQLDTSIMLDI